MDSAVAGNLQGLDLTVDIRTVLSKEYFEKERPESSAARGCRSTTTTVFRRRVTISYASCWGLDTGIADRAGTDGRVRAFHNICRHRGSPLAAEPGGNQRPAGTTAIVFVAGIAVRSILRFPRR
jgi:hypothetical protein